MPDTCTCPPATNIYCQGSRDLGVFQPTCQIITDESRVSNPYYDSSTNITYFTYGLLVNCTGNIGSINDFLTLICENIPLEAVLRVEQRLDGNNTFTPVNFDFNNSGGQQPPQGYKYLRIIINGELQEGASAVYRIALAGNYPADTFNLALNAFVVISTDRLSGFFINTGNPATVPGCPAIPRLTVMKSDEVIIENNMARIEYSVKIGNTGNVNQDNILFNDVINYNGTAITIGTITVDNPDIMVDTSVTGIIRLTGNIGSLQVGNAVIINYTVPIVSFSAPGTFMFNNAAMVTSEEAQGAATSVSTIEVIELLNTNCCVVNGVNQEFDMSVSNRNSPDTSIVLTDNLTIPDNITLSFTSFSVCSAVFADSGENVPLNEPITNDEIIFTCSGLVPQGATVSFRIEFIVNSTTQFGTPTANIVNTIEEITLQNNQEQILLGLQPALPNTSQIAVNGSIVCQSNGGVSR